MALNFGKWFPKRRQVTEGPSEIGRPTNVLHEFHVVKNAETGQLEGLPDEWIRFMNTQITHKMGNGPLTNTDEQRYEYTEVNGLILSDHYIPEEVLVRILSFVDIDSLVFSCRRVCVNWNQVIQKLVLKYMAEDEGFIDMKDAPGLSQKLAWSDYYWIISKKPFGKNLLRNNCGQDKLTHWEIKHGGNGWVVESTPQGADNLPAVNAKDDEPSLDFNGLSSCFATSYQTCSKNQYIELKSMGLTPHIMDHLQPPIEVSEWFACRIDCGSLYELRVKLLDENKKVVNVFEFEENFSLTPREIWRKVTHVFTGYGVGVRYVLFFHGGKDTQYWAGHYGSKMSGGVVKVLAKITDNPAQSQPGTLPPITSLSPPSSDSYSDSEPVSESDSY